MKLTPREIDTIVKYVRLRSRRYYNETVQRNITRWVRAAIKQQRKKGRAT